MLDMRPALTVAGRATPLRLVGGDFGNSTALLVDGGATIQIPSFIGSGNLDDLLASRGGAGGVGSLASGEYVIEQNGQTYFVGDLALSQTRNATSARADTARYANGHTLRLLMALAGAMYSESSIRLRVVTGVPPVVYKEQPSIKAAITHSLLGTHTYTFADARGRREITLNVEAVAVVMEGVAALATLGQSGVPIGLIDVGGYTTDITWFDGQGRVVDARTQSKSGVGVERIGEQLSQQFRAAHGRALGADEIASILAAYLAGEDAVVYHRGPQVISVAQVRRAVLSLAGEINTFLAQHWSLGADGTVGADGAYVQLIGGGARFFPDELQAIKIDTAIRTPDEPEQTNAQSYALFARRIEERGRWPQEG